MEENVGGNDRLVRILLGAVFGLVSLGILGGYVQAQMILSPILGVLSLALLVTAYTRQCKFNEMLGRDTSE